MFRTYKSIGDNAYPESFGLPSYQGPYFGVPDSFQPYTAPIPLPPVTVAPPASVPVVIETVDAGSVNDSPVMVTDYPPEIATSSLAAQNGPSDVITPGASIRTQVDPILIMAGIGFVGLILLVRK